MAFFEDLLKGGNMMTGVAVAVGATILAPVLVPAATRILRPAAKTAVKAGLVLYDRGREAVAEVGEMTGDVVAEARAEMEDGGLTADGGDESADTSSARAARAGASRKTTPRGKSATAAK